MRRPATYASAIQVYRRARRSLAVYLITGALAGLFIASLIGCTSPSASMPMTVYEGTPTQLA